MALRGGMVWDGWDDMLRAGPGGSLLAARGRSAVLWDPLLKATARLSSWVFMLLFCCSRGVWTLLLSIYCYDSEKKL